MAKSGFNRLNYELVSVRKLGYTQPPSRKDGTLLTAGSACGSDHTRAQVPQGQGGSATSISRPANNPANLENLNKIMVQTITKINQNHPEITVQTMTAVACIQVFGRTLCQKTFVVLCTFFV
ncbi:MAG: hypothetical protein LBD59_00785 [Prevotellaceae bacterium]|nr:hypothetical protein [Prevotellaceae bacterium]